VVAALGDRVKRHRDDDCQATCPAHDDREASLHVSTGDDGRVLLKCFAGCSVDAIVAPLSLTVADLFPEAGGRGPLGTGIRLVYSNTSNTSASSTTGCTLAQYAEAKHLPVAFLEGLGLADMSYLGRPAVRIPYLAPDGSEAAVQFRLAFEKGVDDRFRWKSGSKPTLYGLRRLHERRPTRIALVEGTSDCQTLWLHELDALGLPSASTWRTEWDQFLVGLETIDVVIEPDRGGEAVETWLDSVSFRDRVRLVRLDGAKDPSELYLQDPETFLVRWNTALTSASQWSERERTRRSTAAAADFLKAESLLRDPHLFDRIADAIRRSGYAGDPRPALIAYVAVTSRILERPVNAAFVALSGAGKNRAVDAGLALHPADAVYVLRAGSARALVYSDESFEHRVVLVSEADSIPEDGPAASAVRSLAADAVMSYDVVEKNAITNRFEVRHIVKPGPTGLITTSTKSLPTQMATRVLEVSLPDDPVQTREVMRQHARTVRSQRWTDPVDLECFHAFQRWIVHAGEHQVEIPFAERLAELVPADAVRMRRDFRQLLTMIEAIAVMHQVQRTQSANGWILANADDYRLARHLLEAVFDTLAQDAVTPAVRETVLAVEANEEVSEKELADRLKVAKSTVSYRVKRALAGGWLANHESRKGYPARLARGVPLPDVRSALPTIEEVFECSNQVPDAVSPPPPSSGCLISSPNTPSLISATRLELMTRTTSMSNACEYVTLRGGLTLPVAVVSLALELEARGLRLTVDGDGLLASPRHLLTDVDRQQIKRWRLHLLALLDYCTTDHLLQ
jgi:hypothetical protein